MAQTFTIYSDASGQAKPGDILCVAGFGSSAARWLKFETRWHTLLKRHGIVPPFDMTEFANGVDQYVKFKENQAKCIAFLSEAIETVRRSINKGFAVSVAVDDLRRNQNEYQLPGKINDDNPYIWCTMLLYHQVSEWLERHPGPKDPIEVVLEGGDVGQLAFPKRLRELCPGLDLPIFKDRSLAPLQAADMWAWECRRNILRESTQRPPRKSFMEMRRRWPHKQRHYDLAHLSWLCKRWGFPKRDSMEARSLTSRRKDSIQ